MTKRYIIARCCVEIQEIRIINIFYHTCKYQQNHDSTACCSTLIKETAQSFRSYVAAQCSAVKPVLGSFFLAREALLANALLAHCIRGGGGGGEGVAALEEQKKNTLIKKVVVIASC